jgi:CRP-like cAMP-binding protein
MTLDLHRPYPGVALVVSEWGAVLFGAPADAFKATKKYCADHKLPFPRQLIAPQHLLVEAAPQFNPEFFLYDFLFVYGAAFKPELANERLQLVLDFDQVQNAKEALRITLTGPTRAEMSGYLDASGKPIMDPKIVEALSRVSEHMAIKKGDRPRTIDDSIDTVTFDRQGVAELFGGKLRVARTGVDSFEVSANGKKTQFDLRIQPPVVPFATLPTPEAAQRPLTFGIKPLGTRSGFDLSGPTTGFVMWVNGRAVIYDGPVGTRFLLESQGISPQDVEIVVLSHCHEDHMGAFVELFLAGYRPKVLTSEPIFRSALVKLSSYFKRPAEEVAALIDFRRVVPGVPVQELGATFEFFYTVHSIPTLGLRVSLVDRGITHSVQISGDTMHHDGLDKMHAEGVLDEETWRRMKSLVPAERVENAHYFADVGEALIHGHPKDWAGNPNHMLYYHCADNDHTRSFGQEIAVPGRLMPLVEATPVHPATPGRLLSALRFLDMNDPGWFQSILFRGQVRKVEPGEILAKAGGAGDTFTVVVSGTAAVTDSGRNPVTTLRPGDFFGAIELVDQKGKHTATVVATTPMELFDIDAATFHDYVTRNNLGEVLEQIWRKRPQVESARIFRRLETAARNQVARVAEEAVFKRGDVIIQEKSKGDDFYILVEGEVEIAAAGRRIGILKSTDVDNFFGEISAIHPHRTRSASVVATSTVKTLRLRGKELRHLFDGHMGVRYALLVAIKERGG